MSFVGKQHFAAAFEVSFMHCVTLINITFDEVQTKVISKQN